MKDANIVKRFACMEILEPEVIFIIKEYFLEGFEFDSVKGKSEEKILLKSKQADYIIVGPASVNRTHLSCASRLKFVQHQGVGCDNLNADAVEQYKIPVATNLFGSALSRRDSQFGIQLFVRS